MWIRIALSFFLSVILRCVAERILVNLSYTATEYQLAHHTALGGVQNSAEDVLDY